MSHAPLPPVSPPAPQHPDARGRRRFLSKLASQVMFSGILLSGVTASGIVVRYLYPRAGLSRRRLIFLAPLADIPPGTARPYTLPGGETTVVTNTGAALVALSDVCPHLGCKVRWEEAEGGFVCPCHRGTFSKEGKALRGPPADEGKDLKRYELRTIGDSAFIEIEEHLS